MYVLAAGVGRSRLCPVSIFKEIIETCLCDDPDDRPTFAFLSAYMVAQLIRHTKTSSETDDSATHTTSEALPNAIPPIDGMSHYQSGITLHSSVRRSDPSLNESTDVGFSYTEAERGLGWSPRTSTNVSFRSQATYETPVLLNASDRRSNEGQLQPRRNEEPEDEEAHFRFTTNATKYSIPSWSNGPEVPQRNRTTLRQMRGGPGCYESLITHAVGPSLSDMFTTTSFIAGGTQPPLQGISDIDTTIESEI